MRAGKIFTTFLILFSIVAICFGQDFVEDENWLKGLGTEADYFSNLTYPFTKFTKEDLTKGKQWLKAVREFKQKDEWEGIFYRNTGIGDSKLIWNSEGGFFDFYFYHYLKHFDYGTANNSPGFVVLASDKKHSTTTKLIKIKFGERHFLVPENRLKDFCERAVGLNADSSDFNYYLIKEDDMEKKVFGLPILPSKYRHFLRFPIEAKVISIGKKEIVPNEQSTKEYNFDDIYYSVTLNAGKNKNVKKDMSLFVEDLGEWIQITKVLPTKSIGFIRRNFDENRQEKCWDSEGGNGQIISCKEIKVGMKSKTKVSEMSF